MTDSAASDGYAAEMPGNTSNWLVQYPVSALIAGAGTWHCWASVRCQTNASTGNAFQIGIYNSTTASSVTSQTVKLQNGAKDSNYHDYDLGTHQLTTGMYFWFGTVNNPSVTAVYVDRIFLVRS